MLNSLSSIAYNAIRLVASRLLIARRRGLSVKTITVWAWKYGLSLRAAVTKVKARFSIGGYLSSASRSARLTSYMGFCTFSSSLTKAALTAAEDIAK